MVTILSAIYDWLSSIGDMDEFKDKRPSLISSDEIVKLLFCDGISMTSNVDIMR